jgi:uncharacterized protein YbjT (DUF2867 family)
MGTQRGATIVVFGSTGTAGSGVVRACLDAPEVAEVRAVTRRPLGSSHAKLVPVMCSDFAELGGIAEQLRGVDACLFCLGVSARKVAGEAEYREIHVTYALAAAQALRAASPEAGFVYLSGAGTRRDSRMMWARVKAEAEDALRGLGLARCYCVRPAFIQAVEPGVASRLLLGSLFRAAPGLGIGAYELGKVMLRLGLGGAPAAAEVLENRELRALVRP